MLYPGPMKRTKKKLAFEKLTVRVLSSTQLVQVNGGVVYADGGSGGGTYTCDCGGGGGGAADTTADAACTFPIGRTKDCNTGY